MSKQHTTFRVSWNPFESEKVKARTVTVAHSDREDYVDVEDIAIEQATYGCEAENVEVKILSGYFG